MTIWQALGLKKLQTPLYEEFYNSMVTSCSPNAVESISDETAPKFLKLPPKSRSPNRMPIGTPSKAVDNNGSPGSNGGSSPNVGNANDHSSQNIPSPPRNEWKGLLVDSQQEPGSPRFVCGLILILSFAFLGYNYHLYTKYSPCSLSFSERQRKWKEELDQELERKRG